MRVVLVMLCQKKTHQQQQDGNVTVPYLGALLIDAS
jgi:hypothetical protein